MKAFKSIRSRLQIVPAVAIVAVTISAAIGLYGLHLGNAALLKSANFTSMILHAKQIDMMHDALRSDVLTAMQTGATETELRRDEVRSELAAHQAEFLESIQQLGALDLLPAIRSALDSLRPEMDKYVTQADELVDLALSSSYVGPEYMDDFMVTFSGLEHDLEALGELIDGQSSVAADSMAGSGRDLFLMLAFWGLLSSTAFLLISWAVSRSIMAPIARISAAMVGVGDGRLDEEIPDTTNLSEVGSIARSLDGLRRKLIEAADLAAERQKKQSEQHAVTEALRIGLNDLSSGNFSKPITTTFGPDYEVLRVDFNNVVEKLSYAISLVAGSAENIRARSNELTRAADDLAHRTETQAATLEQTAAAMDQMTSSVKSSAASTKEVEAVVRQARKEAEDTGVVVKGAVAAMVEIEKSSNHISQIISVIDDIAFQTNLLALNAGVEAARAGEAGRGFAVVASEVGALAQRSSIAAKEIKDLIGASTLNVGLGVNQVGLAGQALTRIIDRVAQISTLMSNIASGSVEQSTGLGEINVGVMQLDLATQQNAAMVEQTTAASQLLSQSAIDLSALMAQFVVHDVKDLKEVGRDGEMASARYVERGSQPQVRRAVPPHGEGARVAGPKSAESVWADF